MKVCVLGSGGLLGHMLIRVLSASHDVYGTTREKASKDSPLAQFLPIEKWIGEVDAAEPSSIKRVFEKNQFDIAINCIGLIKQRSDQVDDRPMMSINGEFPHKLAEIANSSGVRVIQISTDCVFSGDKGNYVETDTPDPVDTYGRSKLLGELNDSTNLTIRTSHIGPELGRHTSFFDWVLGSENQTVNGYMGAIYSGFSTRVSAQLIGTLLERFYLYGNVWHLASKPISKFELIELINSVFDLKIQLVEDRQYTCDRSLKMDSLNKRFEFTAPTWRAMIEAMHLDQRNYQHRSGVS